VLGLVTAALPRWSASADPAALWRWKHVENPFGASRVFVHESPEGEIVGCVALLCWQLRQGTRTLLAGRTTDLATRASHRRRGVATSFHAPARQALIEARVALVFHTPNEHSLGFTRRTTRPIFEVRSRVALARPSRLPQAALGLLSREPSENGIEEGLFRGTPLSAAELLSATRLDQLIERDAERRAPRLHTARSLAYLQWRYAGHPAIRYYAAVVTSGHTVEGVAFFHVDHAGQARRLVVMDVLLASSDPAIRRALRDEIRNVVRADLVQQLVADDTSLLPRPSMPAWNAWAFTVGLYAPPQGPSPLTLDSWSLSLGDLQEI
jgi:GNAT superfamily N-acetyltransferase